MGEEKGSRDREDEKGGDGGEGVVALEEDMNGSSHDMCGHAHAHGGSPPG